MITLKQLRHLQAIIRHGSIHRAAEALHVTPPALTRSLSVLETDMDIQLFDRNKNGMQATAFCLQIQERCARLISDTEDLMREARIYSNQDTGTLSIGVGGLAGETVFDSIFPDFVALNPKVQTQIIEGDPQDILSKLQNRQLDLVIAGTSSPLNVDGLRVQPLKTSATAIFIRSGHPLERRENVSLTELLGFPMLSATPLISSHPIRRLLVQQNFVAPEPYVICSNYQLLKQILLRTNAWVQAPLSHFAAEVKGSELLTLDVPDLNCDLGISIIELAGRSRSTAAERLINLCLERFE
ncbi:LysR family transcriptional regulator [Pseudomonas chlororaphis]|uniref:LysR family transcriptional regulator n=1 Tax=Pseudomonas chlororaphis TaxID=587753 RepID=UPI001B325546|nr:LysR family transcriptional regulator [Pseudomonas chlororaphis]MBP5073147.1 LysR family transcriptional regulator [Pseudomonas chlororaphis]